jgi:biotin carboxyl carrier protein
VVRATDDKTRGDFLINSPNSTRQTKECFMAEEVRAPLAGTILNILVEPGDKVEMDDELVVIEAMKMQNLIYAPATGTIRELRANVGDKVDADTLLLIIE